MNTTKVFFIAWSTLRYALRDKIAAIFILVLPFVIIGLVGMIINPERDRPLGIVVDDEGPWADQMLTQLGQDPILQLKGYDDLDDLKAAVRRESVTAGVWIPPGFDAALNGGRDVNVEFVVQRQELVPGAVREAVNRHVVGVTSVALSTHYAMKLGGVDPLRSSRQAVAIARSRAGVVQIEQVAGRSAVSLTGVAYTAPANLILFLFINIVVSGAGLVTVRQLGIQRRILSTATSGWVMTLGDALGRMLLGLFQAAIILTVGAVIFGIHWGPLGWVLATVGLSAVIAAAFALIVSAISRSAQQALIVGPAVMIVFGMLGGCLWPLAIVGDNLRALGHAFPPTWALDALLRLGLPAADGRSIATPLGVLGAFAAASTVIAIPLYLARIRARPS
jgi:ABC-2 type transport system permease protein